MSVNHNADQEVCVRLVEQILGNFNSLFISEAPALAHTSIISQSFYPMHGESLKMSLMDEILGTED